jgi:secondary thiamine-phosphate synthase enzyme
VHDLERIRIGTKKRIELVNITDRLADFVRDRGSGVCFVFVPHATAALFMNEDEPGLVMDVEKKIKELFYEGTYEHDRIDDNAAAHLASGFLKQFVILPVERGELLRGAWQEVFLVELDGPRDREVILVFNKN